MLGSDGRIAERRTIADDKDTGAAGVSPVVLAAGCSMASPASVSGSRLSSGMSAGACIRSRGMPAVGASRAKRLMV
jgi:cobalamin synthase